MKADLMGGWEVNATARNDVRDGMPAGGGEAVSLVESAMLLRWRAPELALLLADRAVAAAGQDRSTVLRADRLAVFALNRLGRHAEAAHRLLPTLRNEQISDQLRHELHVELAQCAVALGESSSALAAVRPVLAVGEDIAPALRGMALVVAAESSGALGRGDVALSALDEADELFREDHYLDRDTALLLRASAAAVRATHYRRVGALDEAEAHARAGWSMLPGLADPEHDSGQVSGQLMLEMALALLDRGEGDTAVQEARPLLRRPVRAAAASAVGWLRLALASRVHLAEGRHEPALALLADAVEVTQRHGVDGVLAECLEGLSHVHEVRGEFADALHCLRSARAAEARHRRVTETARYALLEHSRLTSGEAGDLVDQISGMLITTPATDDTEEHLVPDVLRDPVPATNATTAGAAVPGPEPEVPDERADLPVAASVHESAHGDSERRRRTNGAPLLVSDLLPRSMLSSGRSGRRRAEERVEEYLEELAEERAQESADAPAETSPAAQGAAGTEPATQASAEVRPMPERSEPVPSQTRSTARAPDDARPVAETAAQSKPVPEVPAEVMSAVAMLAANVRVDSRSAPNSTAPVRTIPEVPPDAHYHSGGGAAASGSERGDEDRFAGRSEGRFEGRRPDEHRPDDRRPDDHRSDDHPDDHRPAAEEQPLGPALAFAPLLHHREHPSGPNGAGSGSGHSADAASVAPRNDRPAPSPAAPSPAAPSPAAPVAPAQAPSAPAAHSGGYHSNGSGGADRDTSRAGMGDLLAEALAAYQESSQEPSGDRSPPDRAGAADAQVDVALSPDRREGDRPRSAGLRLAGAPGSRRPSSPAEALTDPELRLPDLTAEPLWGPPSSGRRPAVGDY